MDPIAVLDDAEQQALEQLRQAANHVTELEARTEAARHRLYDLAATLRPRLGTRRIADACGVSERTVTAWQTREARRAREE